MRKRELEARYRNVIECAQDLQWHVWALQGVIKENSMCAPPWVADFLLSNQLRVSLGEGVLRHSVGWLQ